MTKIMVNTYDGSEASKKECRYIKGEFYIKNKQCFFINGSWYRINSGFITFDNEKGEWVILKDNPLLIKGAIGYDIETKNIILGYYSPNPYKNVTIILPSNISCYCIDVKIFPSGIFIEDPSSMIFYHYSLGHRINNEIPQNTFANHDYPYSLPYCTKHYPSDIKELFLLNTGTFETKTRVASYIKQIGNYSFGVEFETTRGKIPNYKILETGLLPLRDGSISGIEFATKPLSGKTGVAILENACEVLRKYTTFSENESLHLHIGNTITNKEYIGLLYTVCCIIENEIYSMFPAWYYKTSKFKARGKDYNNPLRKELVTVNPLETFNNVAFHLSDGKKYQGLGHEHPSDPEGQAKWSIQSRYCWCNFISLLFGSNKTLEFRVHVPTNDPVKIINWLYICSAILKYTEIIYKNKTNVEDLKSIMLNDIISDVYDIRLSCYLKDYIRSRKTNRKKDEKNGDCVGSTEISAELRNIVLYKDIE